MQRVMLALLGLAFGLALSGSIDQSAADDAPLEATAAALALDPSPAQAQAQETCTPVLTARPATSYVALAWTECPSVEGYEVLRGATPDELAPIAGVNHASHIDIAPLDVGYYAVRGPGGLSAPVVVAWG